MWTRCTAIDPLLALMRTRGMEELWRASVYSEHVKSERWQFSVEMPTLLEGQLSVTDLRWLVAKGYAAHAIESTRLTQSTRQFRPLSALNFPPRTCLVLTELGFDAVKQRLFAESPAECVEPPTDSLALPAQSSTQRQASPVPKLHRRKGPCWNADLHELRMDGRLVKQFKRPAASQELILAVFEEERWPDKIEDPLTVVSTWHAERPPVFQRKLPPSASLLPHRSAASVAPDC
jgi:hypothetical protein